MINFLLENHEFLGNHSIPEFIVGYIFAAALIIGAPVVFLIISFMSALMKTSGKMTGYKEYDNMENHLVTMHHLLYYQTQLKNERKTS